MACPLRVPQVTQQDLLDFHIRAFGQPSYSPLDPERAIKPEDPILAPDYDLGYYSDGVQRTLTDEQIAIFRHSEIRDLQRERTRIANEAKATELSEGEIESDAGLPEDLERSGPVDRGFGTSELDEDEQVDEREYAEFLRRERREFVEATQRQRQRQQRRHDENDRTVSTRRKIREMDEQHDAFQTISYDETEGGLDSSMGHTGSREPGLGAQANGQGRKIWWPAIGVDSEVDLYVNV